MPIALCSDLRFRVNPFCDPEAGQRGGFLLQKTTEDKTALRKCSKKSPKIPQPKIEKKPKAKDRKKGKGTKEKKKNWQKKKKKRKFRRRKRRKHFKL